MNLFLFILLSSLSLANCKEEKEQDVLLTMDQSIPYERIEVRCINIFNKPGVQVVQDQSDLESLLWTSTSLHPDCSEDDLPRIDFRRHTLLGYSFGYTGCEEADIEFSLDITADSVILKVDVVEKGICRASYVEELWLLVSKIDPFPSVIVEKNVTKQ